MARIDIAGQICPTGRNTPTREGGRVSAKGDIVNIRLPYVGMLVYVEDEEKHYVIRSLDERGKVLNYEQFQSGSSADVFKWKGEVESVEARDRLSSTAKSGDVVAVTGQGNFSFVERELSFSTVSNANKLPIASAFTLPKDITDTTLVIINREVSGKTYAYMLKKSGTESSYYFVPIVEGESGSTPDLYGGQWAYYNGNIVLREDAGADMILCTVKEAHWNSMGGKGVTMEQVTDTVNAAKEQLNTTIETGLAEKQNALEVNQMAAVNSGITSTILAELKDGCLASADETNGLIKVKISGTDSYMYVKAEKLTAPSLNMGDAIKYATDASYNIIITTDSDAIIYYTTDGTQPSEASAHATGSVSIKVDNCLTQESKQITINAYSIKNGLKTEKSATYTIKRKLKVTASASGNDYSTARVVTLASNSSDAAIKRGTTADSITTSYTSPFNINSDTTIYAKATQANWVDSDVIAASYKVGKDVEIYYGFAKLQPTDVTTLPQKKQGSNIISFKSDNVYTDSHSDSTKRYMWFAILNTLTTTNNGATSGGFEFPFEMEGNTPKQYTIGKYIVYRSAQEIQQGSKTVNFR